MLASDNHAEAFPPTENLQKISFIWGGTVPASPWPQQPPEPVVVAFSSSAQELLEITPMCQNTGREEGNSEVVFVTFVLLFFTVAALQVLNNWPAEGCCWVRSYTDVLALPAGLGLTEEEGWIRHLFPREVHKGAEIFPIAWPDRIPPNEAASSTWKLMHCPDAAGGFF